MSITTVYFELNEACKRNHVVITMNSVLRMISTLCMVETLARMTSGQTKQDRTAFLDTGLTANLLLLLKRTIQVKSDVASYIHGSPELMGFGLLKDIGIHQA
ncbi:unnamed protein product [Thlaspi arvense]|uniref:Uncharacterized protein n=1 Tax=Thlaspi arvense TaxID=13288 RepID=A0AAU9RAY8_THLAR|nr:unnamed protein product [Thlaspi arvense]